MIRIAISLNTFSPNTQAKSSEVNTNFSNLKTAVEDAAHRAFTWGITGTLATGNEQGMKYIAPQNLKCIKLWYKTGSGTATIRIKEPSETLIENVSVTSSVQSTTAFSQTDIEAGDLITLDITAADGTDLWVTLETQVATIA
ncbi:MAG: hypothetical protein ACTSYW_10535 [Candidatus Heimdallarchaeota archaeon]